MAEEKRDLEKVTSRPSIVQGSLHHVPSATEKQIRDIGAELYQEIDQYDPAELEAERAIVRRKLDWVIMPIVCLSILQLHDVPTVMR